MSKPDDFPFPFPFPFLICGRHAAINSFDHERLQVYHVAIDFVVLADDLILCLPVGRAYLGDQLHRAATSIVLNIAEGAGEFSKKEKARYYHMALRSATECAATIDICGRLKLAPQEPLALGRDMLLRIVSMLVPLVRRLSSSGTGTGTGTETEKPGRGTASPKG